MVELEPHAHAALPCFRFEIGSHHLDQEPRELFEALHTRRDVADDVGDGRGRDTKVRVGDVVDVDEIHRLGAVAQDERRYARLDALYPADRFA